MFRTLAIALLCAVALAACGSDDDETSPVTEPPASESESEAMKEEDEAMKDEEGMKGESGAGGAMASLELTTADSQFGEILFDGDQRAIYLFDKEAGSKSECYGECAAAWPPVLTKGDPKASEGVEDELLGVTKRDDGTTQVTYDGHPLYYYVDDPPGEVLCHGVDEFGGLWLVLEPSGASVQ